MSFDQVAEFLREPGILNVESNQQQAMQYNALIDHSTKGKRNHHKLNVLFWAFNREPFNTIKFHFNSNSIGDFAQPLKEFADHFLNEVVSKFGKPEKKTLEKGRDAHCESVCLSYFLY